MNYYQAREILGEDKKPTGKWHYTCRNDDRIWAVGYCASLQSCPVCKDKWVPAFGMTREDVEARGWTWCEACNNKGLVDAPNPCPGHDTPEEACEHYKEYLLDKAEYRQKLSEWPKDKCMRPDCNSEATHVVHIPGETYNYIFCEQHCNRENVSALLNVGWSMSS